MNWYPLNLGRSHLMCPSVDRSPPQGVAPLTRFWFRPQHCVHPGQFVRGNTFAFAKQGTARLGALECGVSCDERNQHSHHVTRTSVLQKKCFQKWQSRNIRTLVVRELGFAEAFSR